MKRHLHNSLRALFLSLAVLLSLPMLAVEVEIDGINYELVAKAKLATVIEKSSGKYSGEVVIPESVEHEGTAYSVTSIGKQAFGWCSGLTSVTIPNSVTSIGESAFSNCHGLTSVTIPNSVTSIEKQAFGWCSVLTSVTIPNSVTSIGGGAFSGCSGLTSVTIPNSVTIIGVDAFYSCSGLTSVHISDIAAWCNIDFSNYYSNPLSYAHHLYLNGEEVRDLVIPNSVTSIGYGTFSGCSGLTSVTIPNSVTSIGSSAFCYCSGLTSVTIPNSVTSIGEYAFWYCSKLHDVYCHAENVPSTQYDAFEDSPLQNATLHVPASSVGSYEGQYPWSSFGSIVALPATEVDGINYDFDAETQQATVIAKSSGKYSGEVVIPESVEHDGTAYSVTSIGEIAFAYCEGLTSVTIGNSVTSIGSAAFYECSGLTSVHISDIAAWCNIDFADNESNPLCYAHHLYLNGKEVKDLVIPNSVTSIGDYAFVDCYGLTSVTISNSVTSIGNASFARCSGLTSVTIPNSVTIIGGYAFYECSGLTSVTIPNGVTSIWDWAFFGCSGLTSVTIGNSVESIEMCAFYDCPELLDVYCYAENVPSTGSDAFEGSYPENATLHVPAASIDSYKATWPWSSFGKIVGLSGEEPEQPEQPEVEKCATPVVTYAEGKLSFSCETEGAEFVTNVVAEDAKKYYDAEIEFSVTYNIELFATKANCENSDTVSVALVWVENGEVNEETGVISVPAVPVLVQGNGGILTVSGVVQNTEVVVYTIDGMEVDRAVASDGTATIYTGLQSGTIVVVKFGNKSVKVRI